MTPTAFAFLIPVFVIVVFAPFLCVFCIRKRRQAVPVPAVKTKKPALRRAEARERLNAVTEVSYVTEGNKAALHGTAEQREGVAPSTASVSERECAICLGALHAPSPPEPAKIAGSNTQDAAATRPPSLYDASPEAILKLNVCGHEFHAECLVSWVVLRKTSCPICRAVYITKEEMTQYDEEAELASAAEVAASAAPNAPNAAGMRISNWRYFWAGNSIWDRQPARAGTVVGGNRPSEQRQTWRTYLGRGG